MRGPSGAREHAVGRRGRKEREGEGKEKGNRKKKNGEKKREMAGIAAATAAGRARAPVERDARDEAEKGDGTAMESDVGTGFFGRSGDQAGKV